MSTKGKLQTTRPSLGPVSVQEQSDPTESDSTGSGVAVATPSVRRATRPRREGPAWLEVGRYRPPTKEFGVNLLGFLQSEKGVGEACRTTARSLLAAGIPIAFNNFIDPHSVNLDRSFHDFRHDNPYPVNIVHINADMCTYLPGKYPWYFKDRYNIGFWNWELEWFPEAWMCCFDSLDEIWVPSTFTQQAIARVTSRPVFVSLYAIEVPPNPTGSFDRAHFRLPRDTFVFLFAFDVHSTLSRKNPLAVIEAFLRAFGQRRDVALVIKPLRSEACPQKFAEIVTACRGQANIRILRQPLQRAEMLALLSLCDSYVSLHRSEGFGLPLAEAMALGKPVIGTGYSGNVDFMNEENSLPVRYRMVKIEEDEGPYRRGEVWADPDVNHAAEQMRRIVDTPGLADEIGARAAAYIAQYVSPQAIGASDRRRLEEIYRLLALSRQAE